MSFKLSSQSFRDGDYLAEAHILSKDFGSVAREAISPLI